MEGLTASDDPKPNPKPKTSKIGACKGHGFSPAAAATASDSASRATPSVI